MNIFSLSLFILTISSSYGAITFDGTKSSYAQFRSWQPSNGVSGRLSIHFKTHLKDSLMLYQDDGIKDYISIELQDGQLVATFSSSGKKSKVNIGQDLDDMEWHILVLRLDGSRLVITIDKTHTKILTNLAQNNALLRSSGYLYLGGLPRSLSLSALSWTGAAFKKGFVGCVKKLMLTNNENKTEKAALVKSKGTKSGCLNECRVRNPCQNNGTCINRFSKAMCDCTGTGFVGSTCEKELHQIHLGRSDYIVYDMSSRPIATKSDSINIKFRTAKKNAIILKTMFANDYLIVKITKGLLTVTWNLGSGDLYMPFYYQKVHDNNWHELSLQRAIRVVTANLDNGDNVVQGTPPHHFKFNMHGGEGKVYFGGDGGSNKQFVGCLESIKFNGVDIIGKLKANDPLVSVRGKAVWNCPVSMTTTTTKPTTITMTTTKTRKIKKTLAKLRTESTVHETQTPPQITQSNTEPTVKRPTTAECSPNNVICELFTAAGTTKPSKAPPKKSKPSKKSTPIVATDKGVVIVTVANSTSVANTPNVQSLEEEDLGNVPTAIGLVVGSIILFVICAVISIKIKKIRDRKSNHRQRITIEERQVDEMVDSKTYQPDAYDNKC